MKFSNNSSSNTDPSEDFSDLREKKLHLEHLNKFRFERDPFSDNPQSGLFYAGRQQIIQSIFIIQYGAHRFFDLQLAAEKQLQLVAIREILDDVDIVSIKKVNDDRKKLFLLSLGMGQ